MCCQLVLENAFVLFGLEDSFTIIFSSIVLMVKLVFVMGWSVECQSIFPGSSKSEKKALLNCLRDLTLDLTCLISKLCNKTFPIINWMNSTINIMFAKTCLWNISRLRQSWEFRPLEIHVSNVASARPRAVGRVAHQSMQGLAVEN